MTLIILMETLKETFYEFCDNYISLEKENKSLKKRNKELEERNDKLEEELLLKEEELTQHTKASIIKSLTNDIKDKDEKIRQLEEEIRNLKSDDINGFEKIEYKKILYYRDLETNEIYDIVDDKPNSIVGYLNSKNKIKFN